MINPAASFEWEASYAIVNENYIFAASNEITLSKLPEYRSRKYNVFSYDKLYQEFALIEGISDIEKFVNKYGVLGLEVELSSDYSSSKVIELENLINNAIDKNDLNILVEYRKCNKSLKLISEAAFSHMEETPHFIREVKIMRGILELNSYKKVKTNDIDIVKSKIKEIADLANIEFSFTGDDLISEFKLLEHAVKAFIASVINLKMRYVSRHLGLQYDSNDKAFKYIETWQPKTLLGCLYTMLHMDLASGAKTIICKHCHKPHVVLDNRETELHPGCRIPYNTKKTRERMTKAKELYENGTSPEDIYKILNSESEKEIKMEYIKKWINKK